VDIDNVNWLENDERYFVALANEAVALGDLRGTRSLAAEYDPAARRKSRLRGLARRLQKAHAA
jgi:hypothetical protein